jgi:DNA-binding LacI/PurR family transcriptional regulator
MPAGQVASHNQREYSARLREQGLRVPEDVAVTRFDNIRLAEFTSPPLTTVHIPREQIEHIMFKNLVADPKKHGVAGREVVIDPESMVRESTGLAPSR